MNYFEIITAVSKLYYHKAPANFAEISNKRYYDILSAIQNGNADFMRSKQHKFRERKAILNTVSAQQEYPNIYGNILEDGLYDITNKRDIDYTQNYNNIFKNGSQLSGYPCKYTIYNNKIVLDKSPDAVYNIEVLYNTNNFVKQVNTIDQSSASGQKKLYLSSTVGLSQFNSVLIEPDTAREEVGIIDTIAVNDYVTLTANLTNTHPSGVVNIEKSAFVYETDEPNFNSNWHMIIVYEALKRLNFDDQGELQKYTGLVKELFGQIQVESNGSLDDKPRFSKG